MMCCIAQIGMLVLGIVAVAMGKISLSNSKVVEGWPARIVGGILMLPLPLSLLSGVILGVVLTVRNDGRQPDLKEIQPTAAVLEIVIFAICLILALVVAFVTAKPAKPRRRRDEDFGDYPEPKDGAEDRPHRRKPDDRFTE